MAKRTEIPRRRTRPTVLPAENTKEIPQSAPAPVPEPATPPTDDDVQRLTLPVDPKTGFIAWDRLRNPDRTQNTLKRIFEDSRLVPPATATPGEQAALDAVIVNVLYDTISMVAVVTARSRGYSQDAAQLLRFAEQEKAALAPQTIKVLNKYNLLGGKYADEILLLVAVGGVLGSHVVAMQQKEAQLQSARVATAPMQEPPADILGDRVAS